MKSRERARTISCSCAPWVLSCASVMSVLNAGAIVMIAEKFPKLRIAAVSRGEGKERATEDHVCSSTEEREAGITSRARSLW